MRKNIGKKVAAVLVSATMLASLAACASGTQQAETSVAATGESTTAAGASAGTVLSLDQIKLGEDYKDIQADLKFLTQRTDIMDTVFQDYIKEFQKLYPNVNIEYEGITDYANDVTMRLSTGDWGDICMIPTSVSKSDLDTYFVSFGDKEALSALYEENMLNNFAFDNQVYGIPAMVNAQGVVYNKAVFEAAGVTTLPKTPEEFIAALQKIKDNTDAIPMYTNFAAGWTMTAWDAYIDGSATGDADFVNTGLTKGKDPFADRGDGTGPYAVYNILYEAVSKGLTEEDPTTTDWEGSKGMLNSGQIGCMALGSWSVLQMQQAGDKGDDIGYMSFPITVEGKQYASAAPDYCYGVNVNSTEDEKIAALCYVKFLTEKSGFAQSQGGISVVKGDALPSVLEAFDGVELIVNEPAPAGEENLWNDINNASELGLNVSGAVAKEVVEAGISGSANMEELSASWNEKWTAAQNANGITH